MGWLVSIKRLNLLIFDRYMPGELGQISRQKTWHNDMRSVVVKMRLR